MASPTFPVAIPHPPPSALKEIAYLSGWTVPSVGACQERVKEDPVSAIVKFVGAPMLPDALEAIGAAKSQPTESRKAADILNFLVN